MIETPAVAPVAEPVAETSLAEHEQAFQPGIKDRPAPAEPDEADTEGESDRDDKGQFKPRRAKSQRASVDDVETINQLTKRVREAEESLGIKVERKEGESERVYNLRRRAELLEAKREAAREAKTAPEAPAIKIPPAPKPFTEREPQYEDFANEQDQYQAHMRALAAYDRRKEAHEAEANGYKSATEQAIHERNARRDAWMKEQETQHLSRMASYHESHPEAQGILEKAGDVQLTPALYAAIMTAPNSPELLILVASDENLRDDMTILTEGKTLNRDLVALVQRRLNRGLQSASTGSDTRPAQPVPAVPRPPNPVRTGPMKSGDTPPSDDDNSVGNHEKHFGVKRR